MYLKTVIICGRALGHEDGALRTGSELESSVVSHPHYPADFGSLCG